VTESRVRIERSIADSPGIHFRELVRRLDLAPGQVQYHLRRLRERGAVVEERLYGRTHYYPPEYDDWERGVLSLLRRETARDVLVYLLERGPSRPGAVADDLDIARSTLEWHLDHLIERDLVEKRRSQGNRVTLAATRPADTVELLGEIEPTLPDRMVDRFTRLVDRLLY